MACIRRFAAAILRGKTEIELGTIRVNILSFFLHLIFTLPHCRTYTPRDLNTDARGQMPDVGEHTMDQNVRQIHKGGPP